MKIPLPKIVLLAPLFVLVLAVAAWLSLPWPVLLRWVEPGSTSVMRYRLAQPQSEGVDLELRHDRVPLEEISDAMIRAVVLAEDARFREHGGVDWYALADELRYGGSLPFRWRDADDRAALLEALRYGWENREELRGRSTITQQLAKNLYYTPERSLGRKLGEFFVARRLEWFLDKDRILEVYLNSVELGEGVFGVEAAAREYFGVPASDLSAYQAASLAATLPHPLTSNPGRRPARMAWRRDVILRRMSGGATADLNPVPEAPPEIDPPPLDPFPEEEPADAPADVPDTAAPDTTPGAPGVVDSAAGAAPAETADTSRADTSRADTSRADTSRADTSRDGTSRADTSTAGTELAPRSPPDSDATPPRGGRP